MHPAARQSSAQWQADMLAAVPGRWRERVRQIHVKKLDLVREVEAGLGLCTEREQAANLWLMQATERMRALRVPVNLSDDELCDMARECAKAAFSLAEVAPGIYSNGLEDMRARMGRYCNRYGIKAPGDAVTDRAAIARMSDDLWWRRNLRVSQARGLEREAIALGFVHRHAEIYASTATVERRASQRRRNAAALESTLAINTETGEEFRLAELAALSVANPRIRRGELMVRVSGFEAVAVGLGNVADFVTLTTPSKFHPKKTENGMVIDNPKYNGATPREAQRYLTGLWAKIRATLARENIRPYGFRVAEPHHDGTPHWHLLLFVAGGDLARLREIIRAYALAEDGHEPGAQKNRVAFEAIDRRRGSAAGYIAKYISKNIDGGGYQVQGDIEGGASDAVTPAHRVEAWASTWGIRQFQQIGGAPVGVWRELRRTARNEQHGATLAAALSAADAGNWGRYIEVMGGPAVERKYLPLRVAYTEQGRRWDAQKGVAYDAPKNRYGEAAAAAVYGVREVATDTVVASNRYKWVIKRSGVDSGMGLAIGVLGSDLSTPWSSVNNCTRTILVRYANDEIETLKSWESWKKWMR